MGSCFPWIDIQVKEPKAEKNEVKETKAAKNEVKEAKVEKEVVPEKIVTSWDEHDWDEKKMDESFFDTPITNDKMLKKSFFPRD